MVGDQSRLELQQLPGSRVRRPPSGSETSAVPKFNYVQNLIVDEMINWVFLSKPITNTRLGIQKDMRGIDALPGRRRSDC